MSTVAVGSSDSDILGKFLGTDAVKLATLTLTDADIKTNPAIFEIVPAAGAGKTNVPLWAFVSCDFSNGAYTNVHSGGDGTAYIGVAVNNENGYGLNYIENLASDSITAFTDLFTNAGAVTKRVFLLTPHLVVAVTNKIADPDLQALTDYQGNIVVRIANDSDGALTGGGSGNTIKITLAYTVITL